MSSAPTKGDVSSQEIRVPSPLERASVPVKQWADRSSFNRPAIVLPSALIVPVLYFLFIARYAVNFIFSDQWSNVAMLHAALHGDLRWSMLWSQHNENRMLFPNLAFIAFARLNHFDTKSIMYASAVVLSVAFFSFLALYRIYARQWLGPVFTLLFGAVWFSLADWENALWGFQFAWYLIVFCAMFMLLCLSWKRVTALALVAAISLAVIASYSSLQGLSLWPMGLLVLVWRIRDRPRVFRLSAAWVVCGFVTTALYFRGYNSKTTGGGSLRFAIHHPVAMVKYFLAAVGNVFSGDVGLRTHELLGLVLSLVAVFVFYRNCRETPGDRGTPLPASLILFAFLFDLSIAFGRVSLGVGQALSSRYTMANILLLVGIAVYLVSLDLSSENLHAANTSAKRTQLGMAIVLALILIVQIGTSTKDGIERARTDKAAKVIGARVMVNLSEMPVQQRSPYVKTYVYPSLPILEPLIRDAREDQLSAFAPGLREKYEKAGPPRALLGHKS